MVESKRMNKYGCNCGDVSPEGLVNGDVGGLRDCLIHSGPQRPNTEPGILLVLNKCSEK